MTTRRFHDTEPVRYQSGDQDEVRTAELVEGPDHVVTREWHWYHHFGPVPGQHAVTYTCTCGGYSLEYERPASRHLDSLRHFASTEERAAFEAEHAERQARILRQLGGGTDA